MGAMRLRQLPDISTHAPRTGSDRPASGMNVGGVSNFNPRSPHGERRRQLHGCGQSPRISTHAPRTGSDMFWASPTSRPAEFQPTLPARGATTIRAEDHQKQAISTHAPRTGSDYTRYALSFPPFDFNPRSPHGERRQIVLLRCIDINFNPRSPHGERLHP